MGKRFIDTDIFKKPHVRGLDGAYKLLYIYIFCECNHAGIWDVELDVAGLRLGFDYTDKESLKVLGDKVIRIREDKWYLADFIDFQYGTLNPENRVHKSVIEILDKYEIKGLIRASRGCKDKEKDKEKDNIIDNIPYNKILEIFTKEVLSLSKPSRLTKSRKGLIRARWEAIGDLDNWKAICKQVQASRFLTGHNDKNWRASFDWILKETNFTKIVEGNYDVKEAAQIDTSAEGKYGF